VSNDLEAKILVLLKRQNIALQFWVHVDPNTKVIFILRFRHHRHHRDHLFGYLEVVSTSQAIHITEITDTQLTLPQLPKIRCYFYSANTRYLKLNEPGSI